LFSRDHGPTDANWQQEEPADEVKPFDIPKREVWEAFKKVKANQGAAGVDGQTIADFEADLSNNLYELWNRLSSGSYFPPPVRRVDIPKVDRYHASIARSVTQAYGQVAWMLPKTAGPTRTARASSAFVVTGWIVALRLRTPVYSRSIAW
jgi:retron-type reverse transcriptase